MLIFTDLGIIIMLLLDTWLEWKVYVLPNFLMVVVFGIYLDGNFFCHLMSLTTAVAQIYPDTVAILLI